MHTRHMCTYDTVLVIVKVPLLIHLFSAENSELKQISGIKCHSNKHCIPCILYL